MIATSAPTGRPIGETKLRTKTARYPQVSRKCSISHQCLHGRHPPGGVCPSVPARIPSTTVSTMTTASRGDDLIIGRCSTPGGPGIATYDFGGRGPDLLLVHATGFCAEVFIPMARALGADFHCWGLDLRAHGRSDRPDDGNFDWPGFAADVLAVVDHLGLERPFGFGHSCGGAAVLLAEEARSGVFGSLYCFEPVVYPTPAGL